MELATGTTPPRKKDQDNIMQISPLYLLLAGLFSPLVTLLGVWGAYTNERRKAKVASQQQKKELEDVSKQEELERYKFQKGVRDELRDENKTLKEDYRNLESRFHVLEIKFDSRGKENSDMQATMTLLLEQNSDQKIELTAAIIQRDSAIAEKLELQQQVVYNRKEISDLRDTINSIIGNMRNGTIPELPKEELEND